MKHYIVKLDEYGNTISQSPPIDDWSEAVKRCGQLTAANQQSGSAVAGYEVVSEQEDSDVGM